MTVIELLVVMSTITILLAIGVPKVEDFAIRARVNEGLNFANAARQSLRETCISNPHSKIANLEDAGFDFRPTKYVAEVIISADCSSGSLWVGVITRDTGAHPDPYIGFTGTFSPNSRQFTWRCQLLTGNPSQVPGDCEVGTDPNTLVATNF
ncbi:MAG TPA: hypothetical protein VFG52_09660 [Xanthomonadales bacterium]|nr:hypothetical protein [Xanthomonadales bacterium]